MRRGNCKSRSDIPMSPDFSNLYGRIGYADHRPRKRPRTLSKDPVELWWDAMRSDEMVGNGLPVLRYPSSAHVSGDVSQEPTPVVPPKKRKKVRPPSTNTLLYHMNGNIRTMRKVRSVYTKFAALNINNEDGTGPTQPHEFLSPPAEDVEEVIDDRPWRISGSEGEVGEQNADDCMHWMGSKVLEHAGFQGLFYFVLSRTTGNDLDLCDRRFESGDGCSRRGYLRLSAQCWSNNSLFV